MSRWFRDGLPTDAVPVETRPDRPTLDTSDDVQVPGRLRPGTRSDRFQGAPGQQRVVAGGQRIALGVDLGKPWELDA